ncbi:MAG: multicopper oxidase domain-containing protein [Actinobacteria bacterium]|nr:multicopper oxidase domain-containing protein [Actinomycetota bacterium]
MSSKLPRGLGALPLLALAGAVLWMSPWARGESAPRSNVHEVWIAAVPERWNIVPNGRNAIEKETFHSGHAKTGSTTFKTIVYRRYTRDWGKQLPNQPGVSGDNDGIPGPLIRARVGDRILVHFKNLDNEFERPHSMHFHGVRYPFGSDGAYIPGFSGRGASVKPGDTFTYRLEARPDSVGVWPYHDHSPSMADSVEGGLYGAISILGRHERAPDREFVVFLSRHLGFMTINGRAFVGNTPVLRAKVGELVQWDVLTLGDEFHTFHVHGHRWRVPGAFEDTRTVGPAESFRVRWREDVPGTWLYHCHVEGHMAEGMIGIYRVTR